MYSLIHLKQGVLKMSKALYKNVIRKKPCERCEEPFEYERSTAKYCYWCKMLVKNEQLKARRHAKKIKLDQDKRCLVVNF